MLLFGGFQLKSTQVQRVDKIVGANGVEAMI